MMVATSFAFVLFHRRCRRSLARRRQWERVGGNESSLVDERKKSKLREWSLWFSVNYTLGP